MSSFTCFTTPAHQGPKDYQQLGLPAADLAAFQKGWSDNVAGWTEMSIIGNPWSNLNDAPRDNYYNPLTAGMGTATAAVVEWTPFPNRLIQFLTNPGITNGGQLTGEFHVVTGGRFLLNVFVDHFEETKIAGRNRVE